MKPADWMKLLEQLTAALAQTAVEVTRHEETLASPLLTSDLSGERHISWQRALERFGERLQDCRGQVAQAEQQAHRAEAALAEVEAAVRGYRGQLDAIRRKLAQIK